MDVMLSCHKLCLIRLAVNEQNFSHKNLVILLVLSLDGDMTKEGEMESRSQSVSVVATT